MTTPLKLSEVLFALQDYMTEDGSLTSEQTEFYKAFRERMDGFEGELLVDNIEQMLLETREHVDGIPDEEFVQMTGAVLDRYRNDNSDVVSEEARLAEEAKIIEEARVAEETRLAEEARVAEEARLAGQEGMSEVERFTEEARLEKEARLAENELSADQSRSESEPQKKSSDVLERLAPLLLVALLGGAGMYLFL